MDRKVFMKWWWMRLGFSIAFLVQAILSHAELTATVAPGYVFSSTERPSTSTLNRLGMPTITITGTLDGTNAGISAGSINANMFAASVVDNDTIDFTNSSPQAIRIKEGGVDVREIAAAIAGDGLGGGGGAALSNKVDNLFLGITNDVMTIKSNLPVALLNVSNNCVVVGVAGHYGTNMPFLQFATNMYGIITYTSSGVGVNTIGSAGPVLTAAHGLGVVPKEVGAVLICSSADAGYLAGDELQAPYIFTAGSITPLAVYANATNVGASVWIGASSWSVVNKTTGSFTSITPASWTLKIYARP